MPRLAAAVAVASALALALPATAGAGTVTSDGTSLFYVTDPVSESVTFGVEMTIPGARSETAATVGTPAGTCVQADAQTVGCPGVSAFVATGQGGDDNLDARPVTGSLTLQAHGGPGGDRIYGTPNADALAGDDGDDNLYGQGGNDVLDGGAGANVLDDGEGNDVINGGPGGDTWIAGAGTDTFTPGAGTDSVDYGARTAPVTITFNGVADDGQAGEGDNVGADAEEATGGAGNDRIVANNLGDRLHGGPGDDTIVGGAGEDRLEGQEGNDTIDARDGRFDSIDCGPGSDVVLADPGDSTEGCEVAPDLDGDGYLNAQDCAPTDPAVHPGAGEIYGNAVDEDCSGGPGYLRVIAPISYLIKRHPKESETRFTRLRVGEVQPGDTIELRCSSRKKRCPFTKKTVIGKTGQSTVDLLPYLKKRYLKRNATVEIRVLRANQIGRVQRFTVAKAGKLTAASLCLGVGAATPSTCTT